MDRDEKIALAVGFTFLGVALHGKGQSVAFAAPPAASGVNGLPPRIIRAVPSTLNAGQSLNLDITGADGICVLILYFQPDSVAPLRSSATILSNQGVWSAPDQSIASPYQSSAVYSGGFTLEKYGAIDWRIRNAGMNPINTYTPASGPYTDGPLWGIIYPTGNYLV